MRPILASLILAAGLAGAAQAQTTAPAVPVAPAAAPAAAAPAAPVTATPAAPAAEAAPTLPTTGDGAAIISALERVCVPAVRGQGIDKAAKAAGLKQNRRDSTWTMALGGDRNYVLIFQPQFSNTSVCQAEVHYAIGQDAPIVTALNIWSFLHQPELVLAANYVATDADGVKRVRKSWEHLESSGASVAVNFSTWKKPDDTPLNPRYDTGMLFYQERAGS